VVLLDDQSVIRIVSDDEEEEGQSDGAGDQGGRDAVGAVRAGASVKALVPAVDLRVLSAVLERLQQTFWVVVAATLKSKPPANIQVRSVAATRAEEPRTAATVARGNAGQLSKELGRKQVPLLRREVA